MASAVARREAVIEAIAAPPQVLAASKAAPALPVRSWHMIVGAELDYVPGGDALGIADRQYLDATRSFLDLESHEDVTDKAHVDAEFTAILRMKTEPLVLDESEAQAYNSVRQRRSKRVGQPLPIE